jgi:hypothetical protein
MVVVERFTAASRKILIRKANAGLRQKTRGLKKKKPRYPGGARLSLNKSGHQPWRSTISFLISPIACAGLSPLGQVRVQFMMVWQR